MAAHTPHWTARRTLQDALEKGDTSLDGLWDSLLEFTPGHLGTSIELDPLVTMYDHNVEGERVLQSGMGPDGLYVLNAVWPDDDMDVYVDAAFVPAGARSEGDIVTLLDFHLKDSKLGRDLLCACYRGPNPDWTGPEWKDVGRTIGRLWNANIDHAQANIAYHALGYPTVGYPAINTTPVMDVPPDILAQVAVRYYPEKPLLALREGEYEDWMAFFPGRGHMVIAELPNPFPYFVTLDGFKCHNWKEWVPEDTMFRPMDEERDPGLAEHLRNARPRPVASQTDPVAAPA